MVKLTLDNASIIDLPGIIDWCVSTFGPPSSTSWYMVEYTWYFADTTLALMFAKRWC